MGLKLSLLPSRSRALATTNPAAARCKDQSKTPARVPARALLRVLRRLLVTCGWLTGIGLTAMTLLAGRLALGPIGAGPLMPVVEPLLAAAVGEPGLGLGSLELAWAGFDHPITVRAHELRLTDADGALRAVIPAVDIGFSLPALIQGRLALARLTLMRPELTVVRFPDGHLSFGFGDPPAGDHAPPPASQAPEAVAEVSAPTGQTAPSAESSGNGALIALLDGDDVGPVAARAELTITDGRLTVDDRAAATLWRAREVAITLKRNATGATARLALAIELGGRTQPITLEAGYQRAQRLVRGRAWVQDLDPAALALLAPTLGQVATVTLPLSGSVELEATLAGMASTPSHAPPFTMTRADFDLAGGPGTLALAELGPEPLEVTAATLSGTLAFEAGRPGAVRLRSATLRLLRPALSLAAEGELMLVGTAPTGRVAIMIGHEGRNTALRVKLEPGGNGTGLITLETDRVVPAEFARLDPRLAALAAVAVPFSGRVQASFLRPLAEVSGGDGLGITFNTGAKPATIDLALRAGAGTITAPTLFPAPVTVNSGTLTARVTGPLENGLPQSIRLEGLAVHLNQTERPGGAPVELSANGAAVREAGHWALEGRLGLKAVPVDALNRLWPLPVAANARVWIVQNLSKGVVNEAWVTLKSRAPLADPWHPAPPIVDGGLVVNDLTVGYFRALPAAQGVFGRARTDGRSFIVETKGGRVLDLALGQGTIAVTALDQPQEWIEITMPVSGPVRSMLTVIDQPPLGYPRRFGIDPTTAAGEAEARLHFKFPLLDAIKVEEIEIGVTAELKGAGVEDVVADFDLSAADLSLALDSKGMQVQGRGRLADIPMTIDWLEQFQDAVAERTRISLRGDATADDLTRIGLPPAGYAGGSLNAALVFTVHRRHGFGLDAVLDLARLTIDIPEAGWRKPAGQPGSARFRLLFDDERPVKVTDLRMATGDLKASGTIDLDRRTGRFRTMTLDRLTQGRSELALTVRKVGAGYQATVSGPLLDATAYPKPWDRALPGTPPAPPPRFPLEVRAVLERMIVSGPGRELRKVEAYVRRDTIGWDQASISGLLPDGTTGSAGAGAGGKGSPVTLDYRPSGDRRELTLQADDAGRFLSLFDVFKEIRGGRLRVTGTAVQRQPVLRLDGQVVLEDYVVIEAPLLARLLNALSITGLIELMSGEGLGFTRLEGDFAWSPGWVRIASLRTSGSAVGLTLAGHVDMAADNLAVHGTIVPIYQINALLGHLPLIGELLSGGEGEGMFAATYKMEGSLADPSVSVNPLSILAPGFLRTLFFGASDPPRAGR